MERILQARRRIVLCSIAAAVLCGCGRRHPECVPLAGKVLIDGRPLKTGFVRVVPDKNRPAVGQIDANGMFRMTTYEDGDGCVQGVHRVEVVGCEPAEKSGIHWLAPPQYAKAATSGLKVTVDKPTDKWVIELTWGMGKPYVQKLNSGSDSDPRKLKGNATTTVPSAAPAPQPPRGG